MKNSMLCVSLIGALFLPVLSQDSGQNSGTLIRTEVETAQVNTKDQPLPAQSEGSLVYPLTKKVEHSFRYHDQSTEILDPFFWLEDDRSEDTGKWVEAQNKVTQSYLESIPFRPALKERLRELLNYERVSAPSKHGSFFYFFKNEGLQNHRVLYRTPSLDKMSQPEVVLDPNTFSKDGTTGLEEVEFSKDGSLMAYSITEGGSDWRKVFVLRLKDKKIIDGPIVDVKFSALAWKQNEGFFYSSYDNPEKAEGSALSSKTFEHKLLFHRLGQAQGQDQLIFGGSERPTRYVGGSVTEDERYLVVTAAQNTSGNQVFIKDLQTPDSQFVEIQNDFAANADVITNVGPKFYLHTDIKAPNYRLVTFDLANPSRENWKDVIPESDQVLSVSTSGGKLFGTYLVDAKTQVKQFDFNGKLERVVDLPGLGTASGFYGKKEDKDLFYSFTSFTEPSTIYRYDLGSGKSSLFQRPRVNFNPEDYITEQVFYSSKDGTKIPMFLVYKKGLKKDGKNPTNLYSYGGFNISLKPAFSATNLVWLENGGIFAQPNIRGGGEYGESWHAAGTKMQKQNVFDDFVAAANYLVENGYTSKEYLAISGRSNGGLLVGATMTQNPELAQVALPGVGVLDMLRYHKFTAGAGWASDYGTADDSPEMYEYLKGYSPYHNLQDGVSYPATLITTADHDDRVVPAHSFKFAARLQEAHSGTSPVLIRIDTRAGHGSVSTEQTIELWADTYSFIWKNMGVTPALGKD